MGADDEHALVGAELRERLGQRGDAARAGRAELRDGRAAGAGQEENPEREWSEH
jgi:hypothetical protein